MDLDIQTNVVQGPMILYSWNLLRKQKLKCSPQKEKKKDKYVSWQVFELTQGGNSFTVYTYKSIILYNLNILQFQMSIVSQRGWNFK